jgi:extracellular factor (EF) 3-hydroxypalmitic acid methyl ester biosynthesis protein
MKSYEELSGAEGRRIFYRPERFSVKSLFDGPLPVTDIGDIPHKLHDISLSGLAATSPNSESPLQIGDKVSVRLRMHNVPIHEGQGRITRKEPTHQGTKIALTFIDGYLDVPVLLSRYKEQSLCHELNRHLYSDQHLIPQSYKLLCTDFVHTLRKYRRVLSRWNVETRSKPGSEENEILNMCEEHFKSAWHQFQRDTNDEIETNLRDTSVLSAMKTYTEMMVTPDLIHGPIWRQAYEKPLGYPGDHLVMNYVYSRQDEGETPFGKFTHRLGLDALECVAARMRIVQGIIAHELQRNDGDPLAITNLACGTAQEIVNTLQQRELPGRLKISLIDQDEKALTHAYNATYPDVVRHKGRASVQGFHSSFIELMKGGALRDVLPAQDVVYSVGLFDYLKQRRSKALLESLYAKVKPGGVVVVGNLKRSRNSGLWAAEMACDWTMHYRTEADMRDMASNIPCESIEIITDPTDRIFIMSLRKPLA